ncbi:MAG: sulfite exporter TauE/SafE family protein [Flavobacteriales bacterium]|nr:sulfite exporter TauE/SafE family protein [Flavobacteriales bacterium]
MLENIDQIWFFLMLLPAVAFLYSSVGHGGASGYLALMALFSFPAEVMKPTALLLNLFVAGISFFEFYKRKHFKHSLFYPFVITSIPAAFLGGYMDVNASLYKHLLGIALIFAIVRLFGVFGKGRAVIALPTLWQGLITGACIGFFSGMIGIGGGIILSPLILLMGWGDVKTAAAVSAPFIWVNSAAGIGGLMMSGVSIGSEAFLLVGVALTGGWLGGYMGSGKMGVPVLHQVLAFVLLIASVKLFLV